MIVRYFKPQSYKKSSYNHSIERKILCDKNKKITLCVHFV